MAGNVPSDVAGNVTTAARRHLTRLAALQRRQTLRSSLALLGVAIVALWVAMLTVGFNVVLANRLHRQADDVLRTRAEAAAATVALAGDGTVSVSDLSDDDALDAGLWIYAGGRALERPNARDRVQRAADALATSTRPHFVDQALLRRTRLYALPVTHDGRQVATVVVSANLTPYEHAEREALLGSLALGLLVLAGIWFAMRLAVGRALGPVDEMTRQAAEWSEHDLSRRFGHSERPAELEALAGTLDGVLDRLGAVVRHEKHFSAELSHELRTPLARITAEVDLLRRRRPTPTELDASLATLAESATNLRHILETLLSTARAELGAAPGLTDARTVVAALLTDRSDVLVTLCNDVPAGVAVGVDAAVLERILSPLLDNAVRYARSTVRLSASTRAGHVTLRVADDGPGVAGGLTASMFDPGVRDEADAHDGAGLGLSLVRRLVNAVDGSVAVAAPVPGQGAELLVVLPAG